MYLAGNWNNWANNNNGFVSDEKFELSETTNGLWKISVPLTYGVWAFKIVVNNNQWMTPQGFQTDSNGNALFWLDDNGVEKQPPAPKSSQSTFF